MTSFPPEKLEVTTNRELLYSNSKVRDFSSPPS